MLDWIATREVTVKGGRSFPQSTHEAYRKLPSGKIDFRALLGVVVRKTPPRNGLGNTEP